jgi:DNA-binding NarL/FixJ family response regulator
MAGRATDRSAVRQRRQGRATADVRGPFVDRESELAVIDGALAAAAAGQGSTLLIDGPAGSGKSRLLAVAGDMARHAGLAVLGAAGNELEQDYPFGVAIQLFEPQWDRLRDEDRSALLVGPAERAQRLFEPEFSGAAVQPGSGFALIHALYRLTVNLVAGQESADRLSGLAILIDDVNWADEPSLRFAAYLMERLASLPIVLMVASRDVAPGPPNGPLAALRQRQAVRLRLGSLSPSGIEHVVRSRFEDPTPEFLAAVTEATGGNPFLVVEVLGQLRLNGLRADATAAWRLKDLAPDTVVRSVTAQLQTMSADVQRLVAAVSVLGDGAALRHGAKLADLDFATASQCADDLARAHVLHAREPLSFVHPLVRSAIYGSIPPLTRGAAHRRAAQIVGADGTAPEPAAAHLLAAPPGSDAWAVSLLVSAARRARAAGAFITAIRMLERGLAESPAGDTRTEIVGELAEVEAAAGLPQALPNLDEAIRQARDPHRRVALILARARALHRRGEHQQAASTLREVLDDAAITEPALLSEVEAAYVAAASLVPSLSDDAQQRRQRLLSQLADRPTEGQRFALAHLALQDSHIGRRRSSVAELAELAWAGSDDHGAPPIDLSMLPLLSNALIGVDDLEGALAVCELVVRQRHGHLSAADDATVSYCRAWALYETGRIAEAVGHARAALDARDDLRTLVRTAYGALAACFIQTGNLDGASQALAGLDTPEVEDGGRRASLLEVRAQLRLAQNRPGDALDDAMRAGRCLHKASGVVSPGAVAWRSTAALAHLALGDRDAAHALASEELQLAETADITRIVMRDLRILGLAEGGSDGLALLERAVLLGEHHPARLEHVQAMVHFGAALRRANRRADARGPLRAAIRLAEAGGATELAAQANTELASCAARGGRAELSGPSALTARQKRVAELAADGLTTRQIAELLFVTPKTVEFHLRQIYIKLDVSTREQLAQVLNHARAA